MQGFGGLAMEEEDEPRTTNTLILGQPFSGVKKQRNGLGTWILYGFGLDFYENLSFFFVQFPNYFFILRPLFLKTLSEPTFQCNDTPFSLCTYGI